MRRNIYHPMGSAYNTVDLMRLNMFEIVFGGDENDMLLNYCKSFTVKLPDSNVVPVNWVTGITQLAGHQGTAYSLNATFIIPVTANGNSIDINNSSLKLLYQWRDQALNASTGKMGHVSNYKRNATINIYDMTGNNTLCTVQCDGLWPSSLGDFNLSVESDGLMEISAVFQADKTYIEQWKNGDE